jgi:diguanylate cyclase (GGDEF)-like protein
VKLKVLFRPYVNFIIIIGTVLGVYSCTINTRPISLHEFFFIVFSISLMWLYEFVSKDVNISFSIPISLLLLCMFGIKIAIFTTIGCVIVITAIGYYNGVLKKYLFLKKLLFNISHPIISSFAVWKLNHWLNVDYSNITDYWKVIILSSTYFFIGMLLINLFVIFHTGKLKLTQKNVFTHFLFNTFMSILIIYTYYDNSILCILFILVMFMPLQKLTKMYSMFKSQEQELFTDSLTKAYNYRFFKSVMNNRSTNKIPFTLIYMDLNNFKKINDIYGHVTGNRILQHFTEQVKKKINDNNILCRFGGDEFCIITDGNPKNDESIILFLKNQKNFYITVKGNRIDYSTSYGLSYYDGKKEVDWKAILETADKAMYEYKKKSNEISAYA